MPQSGSSDFLTRLEVVKVLCGSCNRAMMFLPKDGSMFGAIFPGYVLPSCQDSWIIIPKVSSLGLLEILGASKHPLIKILPV